VNRKNAMRWLLGLGLLLVPLVALAVRGGQWRSCVLTDEAARGRVLARTTCTAACHNITPAELDPRHSNNGPNLQNVYMSLAGTTPAPRDPAGAFNHPLPPLAAARDAGIIWTDENLLEYLGGPKAFLDRKTRQNFKNPLLYMPFYVEEEGERRSAVAYLKAIKDHPECN
jgi:cytochrome c2